MPVHINGAESVDLILDTGATLTCLDSSLVRELSLPTRRGITGAAVGVGGSGHVGIVSVDSVRIGAATARDLMACTMDLQALRTIGSDVRGLLGLNVLRHFRVTLDFQREVLVLTRAED